MNITLNGEKKWVPDGINVLALLDFLKIKPERVAVELNLDIVRKHFYASTPIKEGDSLEVISFMQGGSVNAEWNPALRICECGMKREKNRSIPYE